MLVILCIGYPCAVFRDSSIMKRFIKVSHILLLTACNLKACASHTQLTTCLSSLLL